MDTMTLDCGHTITPKHGPGGTGYGRNRSGESLCYECCADLDRASLRRREKTTLYLTESRDESGRIRREVINWPGSLRITPSAVSHGRHNIARTRTDVWFAFEGNHYHAVQYGENTQLLHCSPIKGA